MRARSNGAAAIATAVIRRPMEVRPVDPDLISIADVSAALRCADDTVRRIPPGEFPIRRVGKTNLYFREDVLRYVRTRQAGHSERSVGAADVADIDAVLNVVLDNGPIDAREPSRKRRARRQHHPAWSARFGSGRKSNTGPKRGNWFVDVPDSLTSSGRRKRTLFDSEKKAVTAAKALQQRIDPITGLVAVKPGKSGIKIEEAIALWAKHEQQRVPTLKKRPKTLETDLYKLKAVARFFCGRSLASITEANLVGFQAARLGDGVKPVTVNGELNIVNLIFNWAVKERHILTAPECERAPQAPVKAIVPTPEEVVRIIEHLPDDLKPLIRFLAETGWRKGEAFNLTWNCVDEDAGFVEIESREGWTPKTQQSERSIPLSDGFLEVIRALPKDGVYVFPGDHPDRPIG